MDNFFLYVTRVCTIRFYFIDGTLRLGSFIINDIIENAFISLSFYPFLLEMLIFFLYSKISGTHLASPTKSIGTLGQK